MYLNVFNIILIIISYQCLICSFSASVTIGSKPNRSKDKRNCNIRIPRADDLRMPRPYSPNVEPYNGYLHIKPGTKVHFKCPEYTFVSIADENTTEITAICLERDYLKYRGLKYYYLAIKCNDIPEPEGEPNLEMWRNYNDQNKTHLDCYLPLSTRDYRTPIPFTLAYRPSIIDPDSFGILYIRHNTSFRITCTTAKFQMFSIRHMDEIELTCIQQNFLLFNGSVYKYSDFRCIDVPKSRLILSNFKCQNDKYTIAAIGFQSRAKFLLLYNICFDIETRSNVYSWHRVKTPYVYDRQIIPDKPNFVRTQQLYGLMDLNALYRTQGQAFAKMFMSKREVNKYYDLRKSRFLSRGHLVAKNEFFYAFQQQATYFFENTAPLWHVFNNDVWRIVENYFRQQLSKGRYSKHVIVTGTYGVCTLPNSNNVQQPLYLSLNPNTITVPKFLWKVDLDVQSGNGIVFVGLNHPYEHANKESYMCKTFLCPKSFREELQKNTNISRIQGLVYCCTIKAFEEVYGQLDPLLWQRNLI